MQGGGYGSAWHGKRATCGTALHGVTEGGPLG